MKKPELFARVILFLLLAAAGFAGTLAALPVLAGQPGADGRYTLRARMPENGGWSLENIQAEVGQPIHLRMTSDDVLHSLAIGQSDAAPVDIYPGQWVETTLVFDQPGRYTFYCTRWCGRNHWRMRGVIEVSDPAATPAKTTEKPEKPLYLQLGLDLDAPHPASALLPGRAPDAAAGQALLSRLPDYARQALTYRQHSPSALWLRLRAEPELADLSGDQLWDAVAAIWAGQTSPEQLARAAQLYAVNCAACHGETGKGDGVIVAGLPVFNPQAGTPGQDGMSGHDDGSMPGSGSVAKPGSAFAETSMGLSAPGDFSDPRQMLGASPALLEGKMLRGGMGTGMPYWGTIFTDEDIDALVAYIYTFIEWETIQNHE